MAGTSGGPSVGILIVAGERWKAPDISGVSIRTGIGGDGGDGGHGGDGGNGGSGGAGGELPATERLVPSLAGPDKGGHGGSGGSGGRGGGGGGGCGGSVVGIWIVAYGADEATIQAAMESYRTLNAFDEGSPGDGGEGGFGGLPGNTGRAGEVIDVIAR